jgi:predicted AAA+ superfamily ATPase
MTARIFPYLHTSEILVLVGPRRSGKSTILYQLMDALEKEGIPQQAMLHINFEEPKLIPFLTLSGIDALYETYREHVFPEGKAFLFLDEIQNVPEWERWLRARSQTEDVKIFVTGSSAKLMSREIATVLTGRHFSFEITPLNFAEYLAFQQISPPEQRMPVNASAPIRHALHAYQQWGGFPAVVLADTPSHKQDILKTYFDDILYKDIVLRHNIRDPILLRNIAVHLLTQTGTLISFQRISQIFQISSDAATSYCSYLQEAFVIQFLSFFSLKAAIRQRRPQKVHALDLGLRNVVSMAHSADDGHLTESLVYHCLRRRFGEDLFYFSGKKEIDFVVREGNMITQIWQVVTGKLEDPKVLKREVEAIEEAKTIFPKAESFLITKTLPEAKLAMPCKVIPLWLLLIEESKNF